MSFWLSERCYGISLHPPIGSHEDVLPLAERIQFTPSPMNYIEASLSKSWSLLRKTANQRHLDTTDSHLKLGYPSLGLPAKATSWRLVQIQLLGINWIEQNTRDSHPVNVHFPSALHPDSTSTRRTVH